MSKDHYGTASAAALAAPSEKKMRPQTAHIRSATMGGTEMANKPYEPIIEKAYSNRAGSAIKRVSRKSLQRVQSANLNRKRKLG